MKIIRISTFTTRVLLTSADLSLILAMLCLVVLSVVFSFENFQIGNISAAGNNTINFQGKIVDRTDGTLLDSAATSCVVSGSANDTCNFQVSIYDNQSAGTLLFQEQFSNVELSETDGVFNLAINSVCQVGGSRAGVWDTNGVGSCIFNGGVDFSQDNLYLEIGFDSDGNASYDETFSRKLLTTVPSAIYADRAGVADSLSDTASEGFVQVQPGGSGQTVNSTTNDAIIYMNETGTASPNFIQFANNSTDVFVVDNQGRVGIGNSAPSQAIDVIGNIQLDGDLISSTTMSNSIEYAGWVNSIGSATNDRSNSVATDSNNNVYITGSFTSSVDFDPSPSNTVTRTSAGGQDVFVTKFDSNGNHIWTNTIGSSGDDEGVEIVIDGSNNIYVAGNFELTVDFDPSATTDSRTSNGLRDFFVTKFDSDGNYLWTNTVGGGSTERITSMYLDISTGNITATGLFNATVDFDPSAGSDNISSAGIADSFLTKYDSAGNYLWTNTASGTNRVGGYVTTIDGSGNVYHAGEFEGTADFDPGVGTDLRSSNGQRDFFVSKYDSNGGYLWTNTVGGSSFDRVFGLDTDSAGNVYAAGSFVDTVDFDPSAGTDIRTAPGTTADWYVTSYKSNGDYRWTTTSSFADSRTDQLFSLVIDDSNNLFVTGPENNTFSGPQAIYISRLNSTTGQIVWEQSLDVVSSAAGGTSSGNSISLDNIGNIYVTGNLESTVDFDPSSGSANVTSAGGTDIFLTKYEQLYQGSNIGSVGNSFANAFIESIAADKITTSEISAQFGSFSNYLAVGGNSASAAFFFDSSTGGERGVLNSTATNGNILEINDEANDTTPFIVDHRGNVAIGKSTANEKLDVGGNIQLDGDLITTNNMITGIEYAGWVNRIGNTASEESNGVVTDSNNNVYITGFFRFSPDFDPSPSNTVTRNSAGGQDVFVTKFDNNGNHIWTNTIGGTGDDTGADIAVDANDNIYVGGAFESTVDFDPSGTTDTRSSNGLKDMFVTKYDSNGNYLWTNTVGGVSTDIIENIDVSSNGEIVSTGGFNVTVDFDPSAGSDNISSAGNTDSFLTKYDSAGNYLWTNTASGTNTVIGRVTNIDGSGNVYHAGEFEGTADFDPSAGTDSRTSNGLRDFFVSKYDSNGNYLWTNTVGGAAIDKVRGLDTDSAGNIYAAGSFIDTVDFDPSTGSDSRTSAVTNQQNWFVTSYNSNGDYRWTTTSNLALPDDIRSLVVDNSNNLYVTGRANPGPEIYISRLNSTTGQIVWEQSLDLVSFAAGGSSSGNSISVDNIGNIYVTGSLANTVDFDPTSGNANVTSAGGTDIFLTKYEQLYQGSNIGSKANPFANVYAGRFNGEEITINNFDLAEEYEVSDLSIGAGDVVRIARDSANELMVERTTKIADSDTVGVISTAPGLYLKDWAADKNNGRPVALAGRVPVKISLENGPIEKGDYLTPSSTPGYAMKATNSGLIVGRALESFTGTAGDSPQVEKTLIETKQEITATIKDVTESAAASGETEITVATDEITGEEVKKNTTDLEVETSKLAAEITKPSDNQQYGKGRIMMFVDLNYIDSSHFQRQVLLSSATNTLQEGDDLANYQSFELINLKAKKISISMEQLEITGAVKIVGNVEITGKLTVDELEVRNGNQQQLSVLRGSFETVSGQTNYTIKLENINSEQELVFINTDYTYDIVSRSDNSIEIELNQIPTEASTIRYLLI